MSHSEMLPTTAGSISDALGLSPVSGVTLGVSALTPARGPTPGWAIDAIGRNA